MEAKAHSERTKGWDRKRKIEGKTNKSASISQQQKRGIRKKYYRRNLVFQEMGRTGERKKVNRNGER